MGLRSWVTAVSEASPDKLGKGKRGFADPGVAAAMARSLDEAFIERRRKNAEQLRNVTNLFCIFLGTSRFGEERLFAERRIAWQVGTMRL